MASSLRWLACVAATALCAEAAWSSSPPVEIARTSHGIAHVTAGNYRDLGFGLAYAYASDNVCALAEQIVTVNGERSRYFGPEGKALVGVETFSNLTSDIFHRVSMDDAMLASAHRKLSPRATDLLRGFVGGYNHYLATTQPSARGSVCANAPWVRPMTMRDMRRMIEATAMLASGASLAESLAEATKGPAPVAAASAAPAQFGLGSNGWAFGREATADGSGMVVANPHFPWNGINRFYQVHLTIPGEIDVMGVMLPPLPVVSIGFNRDVAWTHTVSTAARFTLAELALEPGNALAYRVDGKRHALTSRTIQMPVRAADGSVVTQKFTAYRSIFGPVVASAKYGLGWSGAHAYALHDANRGNVDFIETWLRLATSHSVGEVNGALAETRGIPWVNTIASDRGGAALYADIGRVPNVDAQMSARCRASDGAAALAPTIHVLRGDSLSCAWNGFLPSSQMRSSIRADYVLNSNDSYWLVNARDERRALAPILGPTAIPQRFRTRHGLLAVDAALANGTRFTRPTGLGLMLSNRNYSGELLADDVMALCARSDAPGDLVPACRAVSRWDRHSDLDSGGALLFREFWNRARLIPNVFAVPFDPQDPMRTPHTLDIASAPVRTALLAALRDAVAALAARGFSPDVAIGEAQRISVNGRLVPVAGGDWYDGVLNLNLTRPVDGVGYEPFDGASYIAAFGFDQAGPVAEGMLVYGQSSDPASPYYLDQLDIYAAKTPYRLPFHRADILADPAYRPQPIPTKGRDR